MMGSRRAKFCFSQKRLPDPKCRSCSSISWAGFRSKEGCHGWSCYAAKRKRVHNFQDAWKKLGRRAMASFRLDWHLASWCMAFCRALTWKMPVCNSKKDKNHVFYVSPVSFLDHGACVVYVYPPCTHSILCVTVLAGALPLHCTSAEALTAHFVRKFHLQFLYLRF